MAAQPVPLRVSLDRPAGRGAGLLGKGLGVAARVTIVLAGVVLVFLGLGFAGAYNVPFILEYLPSGVSPALASLELTTLSFAIGFVLALPLGVLRAYPPRRLAGVPASVRRRPLAFLRWPAYGLASGYVAAIRGTPFLVQVFIVYYAVIFSFPRLSFLGLGASFWAGLLALTINTTGYQAEALRGGFQSVDNSQIEAGRAIGLTRFQIFRSVTFPQGVRLITLPLTNEWISNFKTSAILSYIAFAELFFWSRTYVAYQLARPIEAFVMITIFYLTINVTLSRVVSYIEARRRIPGLGTPLQDVDLASRPG